MESAVARTEHGAVPAQTSRSAVVVLGLLALGGAILVASAIAQHHVGTDFVAHQVVARVARAGRLDVIGSREALTRAVETALGHRIPGSYCWAYPPTALLFVLPLAFLPIWWAYLAAMATGVAGYLAVVLTIARPRRETMLAAIAFPAVPLTILYGHSSFVTTALIGSGLLLLLARSSPMAGLALGAASFKPQLGLLVPVALVAGRAYRPLAVAAATTVLLAAASVLLFGVDAWAVFLHVSRGMIDVLEKESPWQPRYQSTFTAVRAAGGTAALAWGLHACVAAIAVLGVWRAWSRPVEAELRSAAVVTGTLLATPYLLEYDLTLLALPLAWSWRHAARHGWSRGERAVFVAAGLLPLYSRTATERFHFAPTPIVLLALLYTILSRAREHAGGGASCTRVPGSNAFGR